MLRNATIYIGIVLCLGCGFKREQADLIIHNANISTMDTELASAEAMAIKDGRIIEVGPERQIMNKYNATDVIDAQKKFVYPGLIDAHCHFLGYGLGLSQADLVGTNSWDEVVSSVQKQSESYPEGWLMGRGWDQNDWGDGAFPTNDTLDLLFPDRPVFLSRVDGHAAIVNSKAMELAGLTGNEELIGGEFIKVDGQFIGVLIDNAVDLMKEAIPKATKSEKKRALLDAQERCFAVGLTTVDDAGLMREDVELIQEMHESGELKMRMYVMLSDAQENIDHFLPMGPILEERLTVRAFKFYADGALGSRGACLLKPYADRADVGHIGFLLDSIDHFRLRAKEMKEAGFQMNTHCIGDSANRTLLQIYSEQLQGTNDLRWRIEHAQVVHKQDVPYFGANSVIPSIQPTHATSDMYWAEIRLGRNRVRRAYAYQELLGQLGLVALGTDFPVEGISPFNTYYAAVARKDVKGYPEGGFQIDNALTSEQAMYGMTLWAAISNFEEEVKGSLTAGKVADFIVVDRDLINSAPEDVLQTVVLNTYVNGEEVWRQY